MARHRHRAPAEAGETLRWGRRILVIVCPGEQQQQRGKFGFERFVVFGEFGEQPISHLVHFRFDCQWPGEPPVHDRPPLGVRY